MPFGSVVSIGRGSVTFRISFETGARLSRSTLLVGMDLSSPGAPWPSALTENAAARAKAADARIKNVNFALRFIELLFHSGNSSRLRHRVVAPAFQAGIPVAPQCPPQRRALQRLGYFAVCGFGLVHTTVRCDSPRYCRATR